MHKYSYGVRWSQEDQAFVAVCPEFPGLSAFGATPAAAIAELDVAIELAVETHQQEGWPLPAPRGLSPYSGQFRARVPPSLHAQLAQRAEEEGVSQNTLLVAYLAAGLAQASTEARCAGALEPAIAALHQAAGSLLTLSGAAPPPRSRGRKSA
ncbi:MAG TPA: type II toxin-antitoxin system HicB family antitoxin [Longimicrobium sp.]|nr:type II toxin-antitoxin system HicB family antitoxin [Longimicrobium sp.]